MNLAFKRLHSISWSQWPTVTRTVFGSSTSRMSSTCRRLPHDVVVWGGLYGQRFQIELSPNGILNQYHHGCAWNTLLTAGVTTSASKMVEKKYKVLYDGDCPLCMQEVKFLQYINKKKDALELVNISSPDYNPEDNNNITYETAMGVMHVIGPDQQVYTKVDAVYEMYSALGMRWIVAYMRWPLLSDLFEWAYMVFARNRLHLTKSWRGCDTGKCELENKSSFKDKT